MAGHDRKKERREQKRREKKSVQPRAGQGSSPYRRIGAAGDVAVCYINRDWRQEGMIALHVLRPVPGGGHAAVSFLIDPWALGLKDAFGRLDVTREEFDELWIGGMERQTEMVPTDLATARRLVAGGIRWAHDHGFRLPPRYERWTALLGDIGDWHTADVRDFGVEGGKLRFVGDTEDLRRRLVGQTLEQFMARNDVEVVAMISEEMRGEFDESEEEDLEDMEEGGLTDQEAIRMIEEVAETFQDRLLSAVRQWCFANGLVPHPRLAEAVQIVLTSLLEATVALDEEDDDPQASAELNVERMLSLETPESQAQLNEALAQVTGLMQSVGGPSGLAAALNIPWSADEEDEP